MKQCKKCGKKAQDELKFCPKCGSKEFAKAMKKRTKIEIIILIAIIIFFTVSAVFLSLYNNGDEKEETTTTTTATTTTTTTSTTQKGEETTAFKNAGTKTDKVYKNEWIGIKFNIPEGYTDTTDDLATDGENIIAYDIALEDKTGKKDLNYFTLHFSNCETEKKWTDYVEYHKEGKELMESLNLNAIEGVKPTDRIMIAGEEYLSIKGAEKETGEIFCFAYRKIENRVIAIMAKGKTLEANEEFLNSIEKA